METTTQRDPTAVLAEIALSHTGPKCDPAMKLLKTVKIEQLGNLGHF